MAISETRKRIRKERYERNVANEKAYKEKAWEDGKLIEENYNGGLYTAAYTEELCNRIYEYLCNEYDPDPLNFLHVFRRYKSKIQDLILHWAEEVEKGPIYNKLKLLIETYWDNVDSPTLGETLRDLFVKLQNEEIQW